MLVHVAVFVIFRYYFQKPSIEPIWNSFNIQDDYMGPREKRQEKEGRSTYSYICETACQFILCLFL